MLDGLPVEARTNATPMRRIRGLIVATACATTLLFGIGGGCSPRTLISYMVVDGVRSAVSDGVFTLLDFVLPVIPPV